MSWCKCSCSACHNANVRLGVCYDANAPCKDAMNANARLGMQWMQMSPWEYTMMWIFAWEYAMAWMSSCRYAMNANAPLWVYHDTNSLMQTQFIQKFLLFLKWGFLNAWNQNILKTWFIIHEKSSHFWLKAPKKMVITVRNLRMRHWLGIWWSGSKDLFSQFDWAKKVAHFQGPFLKKMNSLKIKHLKRINFF